MATYYPPARSSLAIVCASCLTWLLACGQDPPLARSCAGEAVPNCRPYEYSLIDGAELEPTGIEVGDPAAMAHVVVHLSTCGTATPAPHTIAVSALASREGIGDSGISPMLFALLELKDDGTTLGDDTPGDGLIDVMVPNPFIGPVPADADVTLRFSAQLGTCVSPTVEIPYRTGARWSAP